MKTSLIIIIILLLFNFNSKAQLQLLNENYDNVLAYVTKHEDANFKPKTTKNQNNYVIESIDSQNKTIIVSSYYFSYNDNKCFNITIAYPSSYMSTIVNTLDTRFTKQSDLLWKDHQTNSSLEIIKYDETTIFLKQFKTVN